MATGSTPRQIAAEVIQSLVELTFTLTPNAEIRLTVAKTPEIRELWLADGDRALHQHCRRVRDAILTRKPIPPTPDIPMPCPEWPAIEAAMQYASEAMLAVDAGETAAAWRAAAEASYWHGAVEGLLRPEIIKQQAKAIGRKKGGDTMRARREDDCRRAIKRYKKLVANGPNPATGKRWTMDDAAEHIRQDLTKPPRKMLSFDTVRDYLRGVKA